MKKRLLVLGVTTVLFLLLWGCGLQNENKKPAITIYLNDTQLLEKFAPYLMESVPDADLKFVASRSEIEYYQFCQENGELPDIMIVGALSLWDTQKLNPCLMDLSNMETNFYKSYLDNYVDGDNAVRWLPVGGIAHGLVANEELFQEYHLDFPTDYESFQKVCEVFRSHGIIPYVSDYKYDYTCLYTLEGWTIPDFTTLEGTSWRRKFENKGTEDLEETLWVKAFEKTAEFFRDTGLGEDATTRGYTVTKDDFAAGKVAMIRGTAQDLAEYSKYHTCKLLPYYGDNKGNNWILVSPKFHVALNAQIEKDTEKYRLVKKVLQAMFTTESYEAINTGQESYLIPYNKGIDTAYPDSFSELHEVIASNHLYPMLSTEGLLLAARTSVQKLLCGEVDARGAYRVMVDVLKSKPEEKEDVVATIECGYPVTFSKDGGNQAASAVANTLRMISGTDLLVAPSSIVSGSLYAADYTQEMLEYSFQSGGNYLFVGEVTGAQLLRLAKLAVEGYGTLNDPFSDETLPVASGFEMQVKKVNDTYVLEQITINREPIQEDALYSITIADHIALAELYIKAALGEDAMERFTTDDKYARTHWVEYLMAGNQPQAPNNYLTLEVK